MRRATEFRTGEGSSASLSQVCEITMVAGKGTFLFGLSRKHESQAYVAA